MGNPHFIGKLTCYICDAWVHLYEVDFGGADVIEVCYDCCEGKGWIA